MAWPRRAYLSGGWSWCIVVNVVVCRAYAATFVYAVTFTDLVLQMEHFPLDDHSHQRSTFSPECLWTVVLLERSINELFFSYWFELDCDDLDKLRVRASGWKRRILMDRDGIDDPCDFGEIRRWIPEVTKYI